MKKLIDKAIHALNADKISNFNVHKSFLGVTTIIFYKDDKELDRFCDFDIEQGIEFLDNLINEPEFSFDFFLWTIRDSEDIEFLKSTDKNILSLSDEFDSDKVNKLLESNLDNEFLAILLNGVSVILL